MKNKIHYIQEFLVIVPRLPATGIIPTLKEGISNNGIKAFKKGDPMQT